MVLGKRCFNITGNVAELQISTSRTQRGFPMDIHCGITCSSDREKIDIPITIGIHISPNLPSYNPSDNKPLFPRDSRKLFEVSFLQNKSKTINNQSFLERNPIQTFTTSDDPDHYSLSIRIQSWTEFFIKNNIICSSNYLTVRDEIALYLLTGKGLSGKILMLDFQFII